MITAAAFIQRSGLTLPANYQVYDVHVLNEPVGLSAVEAVRDKLRGRTAVILPYVRPLQLILTPAGGTPLTVTIIGLSPTEQDRAMLGLPELPWGPLQSATAFTDYAQILLPAAVLSQQVDQPLTATLAGGKSGAFPIRVSGQSFTGQGIVPLELAAVLRTATVRDITYSAEQQSLQLARTGYSGFRLYARSIDDVVKLHRLLREQGIETIAQVQAIENIRLLDRGLTRLFWLVAVVGIMGGIAALVASLYAAVERKKSAISMLRLLGLSRRAVSLFPIYQSATIAAMAASLAIFGFYALATVINTVFAADLGLGERICQLPPSRLMMTLVITVAVAVGSSLFAAWRTTRIEPAEAIRVE
jgi:putative ABC transport system permease protein